MWEGRLDKAILAATVVFIVGHGLVTDKWEFLSSAVWGVCTIIVVHAFEAAHTVSKEVNRGVADACPKGFAPATTIKYPFLYKTQTYGLACLLLALCAYCSYLVWTANVDRMDRQVIIPQIEVLPYRLGEAVQVKIHAKHIASPHSAYRGYFQMQVIRDVIVEGGSPAEQKGIEDAFWDSFMNTTDQNAPSHHIDLNLPFDKEVSLPEAAKFTDDDTRALISGTKSLYIAGLIRDTSGKSETPYCAIKSPHSSGGVIYYCQSHN